MNDRATRFLVGVLGNDGASAFRKAIGREQSLASAVVPRAILSWLNIAARLTYEGEIPGQDNTYLTFRKSEGGRGFGGAISINDSVYSFENASVFHVAGALAVALGVDSVAVDEHVRARTMQKLGKSIDHLVKAKVAINHLNKVALNPSAGYQISHEHAPEHGMTTIRSTHPQHGDVGVAQFHHEPGGIRASYVVVDDEHQRRGLASAMYAHAEKVTGKKVLPPTATKPVTDQGRAFVNGIGLGKLEVPSGAAGSNSDMRMITASEKSAKKVELPGAINKPTEQQAAIAPQAPQFQAKTPRPIAKNPSMKVSKSQADKKCPMCGQAQFRADGGFYGCICFRAMAEGVLIQKTESGYSLEFDGEDWDQDAVTALAAIFRS